VFPKPKQKPSTRRQPIVTSSSNRNVFSYHANRSQPSDNNRRQSPDSQSERRRLSIKRSKLLKQLPSIIASVVVIISIVYGSTLDTNPKVITINSTNSSPTFLREKAVYQEKAQQILQHSFGSRFKLTINSKQVANQLQSSFPEISSASVTLPLLGHRPVIALEATKPAIVVTGQNNAYVVDTRGLVIMKTNEAARSGLSGLPVAEDQSGLPMGVGKAILPSEDVKYIAEVDAQLKAKQIAIESITLPNLARELRVRTQGQSYYIKFNLSLDSKTSVGTYLALRDKLNKEHITPAEYIDLRVEEKAYYK
jgi:cell division septal protein FtsQ